MSHDVVVVGSGFAGGVVAARLAQHGMRVLVLERGIWHGPGGDDQSQPRRDFPRGLTGVLRDVRSVRVARAGRSRELMLNQRGLFEIHRLGGLSTLTVSAVGGGSLVYFLLVVREDPDAPALPFPARGRTRRLAAGNPRSPRPYCDHRPLQQSVLGEGGWAAVRQSLKRGEHGERCAASAESTPATAPAPPV